MKRLYPYRERMRRTWWQCRCIAMMQFLIDFPLAGIPYWENRSSQYMGLDRKEQA